MALEPKDTPQGMIGAAFANALVAGEYDAAYNLLSTSLRAELSPSQLKQEFESMIAYGRGHPDEVEVISIANDWHNKEALDAGYAYVAINGDGFCEAVYILVMQEQAKYVICEVQWGRP